MSSPDGRKSKRGLDWRPQEASGPGRRRAPCDPEKYTRVSRSRVAGSVREAMGPESRRSQESREAEGKK